MNTIEKITLDGGYEVETYYDEGAESPREWGPLGTIYSNHRDYSPDGRMIDEVLDEDGRITIKETHYYLPVYAYIHSGISLSCGDLLNDQWDSGLFGIIAVPKGEVADIYPENTEKHAKSVLETEIKLLNAWYNGECYGFILTNNYGEEIDSCGGYIGREAYDQMIDEAKGIAKLDSEDEKSQEYKDGKATITIDVEYRLPADQESDGNWVAEALKKILLADNPYSKRVDGVIVDSVATNVA